MQKIRFSQKMDTNLFRKYTDQLLNPRQIFLIFFGEEYCLINCSHSFFSRHWFVQKLCFSLFLENREKIIAENPGMTARQVMQKIEDLWMNMPHSQKLRYNLDSPRRGSQQSQDPLSQE